ncbi:DoxX family protein [Robertkochia aurantiaca]|uniref:DoxX family protein n=1 Tax=Robertkochia aurantiaca TaxID=2873700 RepID=UPI001CCD0DD2|nr:DoxX family protein [Robertkochia sp. 3YJGBD-33]
MNIKTVLYWVSTGLLSALLLYSVFNYITQFAAVKTVMGDLGYPAYLIYFLVIAKSLGVIALLAPIRGTLKEWAYAGLFFNFLMAFIAHYMANDGQGGGAIIALVLLMISYFLGKQVRPWLIRKSPEIGTTAS